MVMSCKPRSSFAGLSKKLSTETPGGRATCAEIAKRSKPKLDPTSDEARDCHRKLRATVFDVVDRVSSSLKILLHLSTTSVCEKPAHNVRSNRRNPGVTTAHPPSAAMPHMSCITSPFITDLRATSCAAGKPPRPHVYASWHALRLAKPEATSRESSLSKRALLPGQDPVCHVMLLARNFKIEVLNSNAFAEKAFWSKTSSLSEDNLAAASAETTKPQRSSPDNFVSCGNTWHKVSNHAPLAKEAK